MGLKNSEHIGKIIIDLRNSNVVYVAAQGPLWGPGGDRGLFKSTNGGKTFCNLGEKSKHMDNHAMWIDPNNTNYYLVGSDGGLYESFDRGQNCHFKNNLPVTQFYRVTVGNSTPFYYVYGGTQDNFTLGGPSRTISASGITNAEGWTLNHRRSRYCHSEAQERPRPCNVRSWLLPSRRLYAFARFERKQLRKRNHLVRSKERVDVQPLNTDRAVLGTSRSLDELRDRITLMKRALDETPHATKQLRNDVQMLEKDMQEAIHLLRGDRTISSRNEPTPPSMMERVGSIVGDLWQSSSAPTKTHTTAFSIAAEEVAPLLKKVQEMIARERNVIAPALESVGAPWIPGRVPEWKDQ